MEYLKVDIILGVQEVDVKLMDLTEIKIEVRRVGKWEEVKHGTSNFLSTPSTIPLRFFHVSRMDKSEGITKARAHGMHGSYEHMMRLKTIRWKCKK